MMEDLITELRNKTQLCRFTRGEVAAILQMMADNGYLASAPDVVVEAAPETPVIEPEPEPEPDRPMVVDDLLVSPANG